MTGGRGSTSDPRPGSAAFAGKPASTPSIDLTDPGASLVDPELQAEIELMTELVLAAAQSPGPLSPEQIDQILGLA